MPLLHRTLPIRSNGDDCLRAFHANCKLLETHLRNNKYLVGEQLTLADLFVVGTLVFAVAVFHEVFRERFPWLMQWFWAVDEMDMFREVAGELPLLKVEVPRLPDEDV